MKIALLGTRGVPANYGGFETCAQEIGKRLVKRGHEVRIYNRSGYYSEQPEQYEGMDLVYIAEPRSKSFETILHTLKAAFHVLKQKHDIHLVFNIANTPSALLLRLFRRRTALLVDGLEWKREKWSRAGKIYFRFCEWLAAKTLRYLIADSREIQRYYQERHKKPLHYIPYGTPDWADSNPDALKMYNLSPGEYFLQITRFEPENNPLLTVEAFRELNTDKKLVLIGGVSYSSGYSRKLEAVRDPRILFPGPVFDRTILFPLLRNCCAYIHGNEVGGTNPALLEAMSCGCFVIARDVPYNREVLRGGGIYFHKDASDLKEKLKWSLDHAGEVEEMRHRGAEIVGLDYTWEAVVDSYESLFQSMLVGE